MESLREHYDVLLTLIGFMLTLTGTLLLLLGKSWFRNWTEAVRNMSEAIKAVSDNQEKFADAIDEFKTDVYNRMQSLERELHVLKGEHIAYCNSHKKAKDDN